MNIGEDEPAYDVRQHGAPLMQIESVPPRQRNRQGKRDQVRDPELGNADEQVRPGEVKALADTADVRMDDVEHTQADDERQDCFQCIRIDKERSERHLTNLRSRVERLSAASRVYTSR